MSENFDNLLSGIAQSAAASARAAGPAAARGRGRQRAVRRRATASVLSVALLAAAGVAGVYTATHAGTPAPVTHSGTPTPTPTVSSSAVPAPPNPTGAHEAPASPTAAAVTGDLHTIVPRAWTPAEQFPFFSSEQWQASSAQPGTFTADRQWFYSCRTHSTLTHLGALGYQEKMYTSHESGDHEAGAAAEADQVLFFFPSTAAAQQALSTVEDDYAHCHELTTGVSGDSIKGTVQQTEQLDGGYAWLHSYTTANGDAPGDPADIAALNHEYFVQRGDVVELVWIGGDHAIDTSAGDLGFLNSLEAGLCVYGGNCPYTATPLKAGISAPGSATLVPGGGYVRFEVNVTNLAHGTITNVTPIVSLAMCSCVNTQVRLMPKGELQYLDPESNTWHDVPYNAEGTGMDYLFSAQSGQIPAVDIGAGMGMVYEFRIRLLPASANPGLTGQFQLRNGTGAIDVSLVHPRSSGGQGSVRNFPIGGVSPVASLPITVVVH
jgi:hypothetical protein